MAGIWLRDLGGINQMQCYRPCLNPDSNKHYKTTFMQEQGTLNTDWIK